MARLLPKAHAKKQRLSQAEAMGIALTKASKAERLGVVDAAAYLGVHKYTLREFIDKGLVNTWQIGARHYLDIPELKRLQRLLMEYGSLAKAHKAQNQHFDKDENNA